jgi:hypothetical protein
VLVNAVIYNRDDIRVLISLPEEKFIFEPSDLLLRCSIRIKHFDGIVRLIAQRANQPVRKAYCTDALSLYLSSPSLSF